MTCLFPPGKRHQHALSPKELIKPCQIAGTGEKTKRVATSPISRLPPSTLTRRKPTEKEDITPEQGFLSLCRK